MPSSGHEHRYPVDCWRYYPDGVTALARWADLDVLYAGTDWEPRQVYDDDSAKWADTMLVAQRPESTRYAAATRLKQMVLRRVLGVQAARRSSPTPSVTQDPGPRAG